MQRKQEHKEHGDTQSTGSGCVGRAEIGIDTCRWALSQGQDFIANNQIPQIDFATVHRYIIHDMQLQLISFHQPLDKHAPHNTNESCYCVPVVACTP